MRSIDKVLVTGGAGFIGSHLAEYYAEKCEETVVHDDPSKAQKEAKNLLYNWNYLKNA